jgi:hypothetical protein
VQKSTVKTLCMRLGLEFNSLMKASSTWVTRGEDSAQKNKSRHFYLLEAKLLLAIAWFDG